MGTMQRMWVSVGREGKVHHRRHRHHRVLHRKWPKLHIGVVEEFRDLGLSLSDFRDRVFLLPTFCFFDLDHPRASLRRLIFNGITICRRVGLFCLDGDVPRVCQLIV